MHSFGCTASMGNAPKTFTNLWPWNKFSQDILMGIIDFIGPSSQGYGFSNGHVWIGELDCEESWVPKNWCFWTVVLEKTLESPWTVRRSNQSILKEISPGCSLEGLMLKLKLQYFGHLMWRVDSLEKTDAGRDWGQEEKGTAEDEMVGWHHWLNGHGFGWTPGVGDGQGGLVCCNSWGHKGSDMTEQLNWNELFILFIGFSQQEDWNGLPFPSSVDHILSELFTITHLSLDSPVWHGS